MESNHSDLPSLPQRGFTAQPRVAAQPRTPGLLNDKTSYAEGVTHKTGRLKLCNAFSVSNLHLCEPRVRVCAATLGYVVEPLHGKDRQKATLILGCDER